MLGSFSPHNCAVSDSLKTHHIACRRSKNFFAPPVVPFLALRKMVTLIWSFLLPVTVVLDIVPVHVLLLCGVVVWLFAWIVVKHTDILIVPLSLLLVFCIIFYYSVHKPCLHVRSIQSALVLVPRFLCCKIHSVERIVENHCINYAPTLWAMRYPWCHFSQSWIFRVAQVLRTLLDPL